MHRFSLAQGFKTIRARNDSQMAVAKHQKSYSMHDTERFKKRKADTLSYEIKLLSRPECNKLAERTIKKHGQNYK